jgi:ATP-binding cassette subfamily F protein 3
MIAKCKSNIASGAGRAVGSSRWERIRRLEREEKQEAAELAALQEDPGFPLEILTHSAELDQVAIRLDNVSFAYPDAEPLFSGVGVSPNEFNVDTASRICLVGENGQGKSTLLRLLFGEFQPTKGEVVFNRHARIAMVNQHHADQINLSMSPLQFMKSAVPGNGSDAWHKFLRKELIGNGIDSSLVDLPAAALSGGLRSRLAIIAASVMRPHVLILDEPTNNLDANGVEALADAIERFAGGVVLVSHDYHFVSRVARDLWVLKDGHVKKCECGLEENLAKMLSKLDPKSPAAFDAVNAYARKKRMSPAYLSGGQASREAFAKELAELRGFS